MGESEQTQTNAADVALWDVPCSPVESGAEKVQLEMREREDGNTALLAYTSMERLVAGCGAQQPWVAVRPEEIEAIQQQAGFDLIAFDVERTPAGTSPSGSRSSPPACTSTEPAFIGRERSLSRSGRAKLETRSATEYVQQLD